jgi:hypothetical protein
MTTRKSSNTIPAIVVSRLAQPAQKRLGMGLSAGMRTPGAGPATEMGDWTHTSLMEGESWRNLGWIQEVGEPPPETILLRNTVISMVCGRGIQYFQDA